MAKTVEKLYVELSVRDCKEALIKAMSEMKSELIEWRSLMAVHGYQHRVEEIQEYIDVIVEAEKERE